MDIKEKVIREIISTIGSAPTVRFNVEEGVDEGVVAKQDWLLNHIDRALATGVSPDKVVIPFADREAEPNELRVKDSKALEGVLGFYKEFARIQIDPMQATTHEKEHGLGTGFRTAFYWVQREGDRESRAQLSVSPDFQGEIPLPDLLDSIGAPQELSPTDRRMHRKIVGLLDKHGFKYPR